MLPFGQRTPTVDLMGNCIAPQAIPGGEEGSKQGPLNALAGLSNAELVGLLRDDAPLPVLQHLKDKTAKSNDDCAAARFHLIQDLDILEPLAPVSCHSVDACKQ